jgi:hypothetical protein
MTLPAATADSALRPAILLDDGQVRIDHHRQSEDCGTLVITFDPLLYLADKPPFGHDFLRKRRVDVIAVRKYAETFYQTLGREEFESVLAPLLASYGRIVAYGSSLGAYAALYFCRDIACELIASSPRVSAHPRYGVKLWQDRVHFAHEFFDPQRRPRCRAHILYDPMDPIDRRFIEGEVLPQFPLAEVRRLPYSGHPSNHFLSEIGFIAPFVRSVIDGTPPPPLQRERKSSSPAYLVTLAEACLAHGKPVWADVLVDRALALNGRHSAAYRARGCIALRRRDWEAAIRALEAALQIAPGDHLARHWLGHAVRARSHAERPPMPPATAEPTAWPLGLRRRLAAVRRRLVTALRRR